MTVGNVFDNPDILEAYSVDRSALKIKPKFVAFPESTDDIRKLLKFFNQLATKNIKVPITPRGAGNDMGGAAITNGIIISTEKLNRLLEIDPRDRLVRVQAGITLKELNTALSVSGLTIPISGYDDDTIGGLISNNPVDGSAGKYGGIQNYVERIEVVLPNGECLQTSRFKKYALAKKAAEKTTDGSIYRKITKIVHEKKDMLYDVENDTHNQVGYPGIIRTERKESLDLMPLFFGAQGTLGIISEVILRAQPLKDRPLRVAATFKDISQAIRYMDEVKKMRPAKIDFYDLKIVMEAKETGKNLDGVIRRLDDGYVVLVNFDERAVSRVRKIIAMKDKFPRSVKFIFEKPETRSTLNELENTLTNYLGYVKDGERVPILTDFYLPPYNLVNFLKDLEILARKLELDLALFGSYSTSIYSLRPKFDLSKDDFNKKATTFLRTGAYIIDRQGGKLAGGTPEGRLKAAAVNMDTPAPQLELYSEIKKIFDPNDILNPDIKLGASSKFTLTHFRSTNQPKIMI